MKCKALFLALTLQAVIVLEGVPTLIATSLVSGCSAHKARTWFVKTVKVPRQKTLLVPPGPEVEPFEIDEMGHRYYDLSGDGVVDCYVESKDFRMFNYLGLENKPGFGWEAELRARGVEFFGSRINITIEDAPENIWSGCFFYQGITDERPITDEMKERMMKEYLRKRPHARLVSEWIIEYKGDEKLYYPFEADAETLGHWPMTLQDWEKIKAKGPVLIEYW